MQTRKNKNGYTLIEVIIAALIFVILITVTMVTFGSNSNLQARNEILQSSSQSAKYISEAIARDIRLADAVTFKNCASTTTTSVPAKKCEVTITYGNEEISYRYFPTGLDEGYLGYLDSSLEEYEPINSKDINIKNMYLVNNDPEVLIHIDFNNLSSATKSIEKFDESVETIVTRRNYPNFYDKFTPKIYESQTP